MNSNDITELRTSLRASKAELAREAGVARPTVWRLEKGRNCQEQTKRKIILALGSLAQKRFLGGNQIHSLRVPE